ncbi:MAG: FAD-binding dehydrogenase [Rhodanobacter sp.]|nr:MAG: FAD-binding dehydrogenase [Rhodanobacter sp.]TAM38656.1 MAG: FAD-binding dehydrogenase [Rhodanobacter sp.]TAN23681.1 MAG: FAD-binding dehydrogenase [Rhodanobacter sp.]
MLSATHDVVIVGAGIAGITCALELLEQGRRVLLLDRDSPERLGGLARLSFGGMFAVDTPEQRRAGIHDSVQLALADWRAFAEFDAQAQWPQRWARAHVSHCTQHVYWWLRHMGIRYLPLPNWVERGQFTPGNSLPRFHMVWGTGQKLATILIDHLQQHRHVDRLELRFDQRVQGLLREGAAVVGCHGLGERDGRPFEVRAGAVVVAAGGINGNLDRVRANWHADWSAPPETLLNGSHRFADGTLHDAAAAAGAQITHLDKMWNYAAGVHHYAPTQPFAGLSLVPPRSALWLNWHGERIGPQPLVSGFDTRDLVTQVCRQPRQYSWQVMNRKIALKELAVSGAEHNPSIRNQSKLGLLRDLLRGNRWLVDTLIEKCADVVVAPTLPELVAKMNALQGDTAVDLATLQDVVQRYDACVRQPLKFRNDEQLRRIAFLRQYRADRLRTCKQQPILDDKALPLIAIREFIISRKSLGGIQTDLCSRALDTAGAPIAGLYAIGEAAGFGGGGVHGLRALEGTFLGSCILTARAAAAALDGRILLEP